jgi:outer membrane protein
VLGTSKELLREITGEYFDELLAPGDDLPSVPPEPQNVDEWVTSSLAAELDGHLEPARGRHRRQNIDIRRAGHYPTVDLQVGRREFGGTIDTTTLDPVLGQQDSTIPNDLTDDLITLQ